MQTNKKAAGLIKTLERLNNDVAKSGILAESISAEQEFLLDKIIHSFSQSIRHIETAAPVLRLDRLKVFLNHLKTGKLCQKFELGDHTLTAEYADLFPEYWSKEFDKRGMMIGNYKMLDCDCFEGERFFFGLTRKQQYHLSFCYSQNPEWGNVKITGRTGKAKLIDNIEQFISYFEKGGDQC